MAWWPRHTPNMGNFPRPWRTKSSQIPASAGLPGPGEIMTLSGSIASISDGDIPSFLTTLTSLSREPTSW